MDTLHHYDEKGFLKAPVTYLICLILLSRAWWLLAMAGVSRQQGSELLALFYPDKSALYASLAVGVLPLILLLLVGNCHRAPWWAQRLWHWGYALIWPVWCWEGAQVLRTLMATDGQFHWLIACHGLWVVWGSLYWLRSRRVKRFFYQFIRGLHLSATDNNKYKGEVT
ncbi:DUF2919 domain-containing protein [Salinivibrio sp. IB872]|jgi:hypothetical protein|uniref:DUF2919 domain-containing protein n=1 Tax=Salinivibrio sp. IB872 TaxID=1766123 RepID=UPI000985BCDE|nr:DUF2919 domain-containing protein [Salinivibrio sp. IB872]OOF28437.1 hypothetical protein BZJ18_05220 [Salinivibrio sp. IB872]